MDEKTVWVAWSRFCGDFEWVEGFPNIELARKAIPPEMIEGEDYLFLNL